MSKVWYRQIWIQIYLGFIVLILIFTCIILGTQQQQRKSEILHRQRQKNWDYFEIDHPKAISDKKLQQLKSKYLRRRTESSLNSGATASIKEENEDASNSGKAH